MSEIASLLLTLVEELFSADPDGTRISGGDIVVEYWTEQLIDLARDHLRGKSDLSWVH